MMDDFYEIDFLNVQSKKSGDAIALRYRANGEIIIHVVDGGFQATGDSVCAHIRNYYQTEKVDHVVATHPDGDHAGGLRKVLEEFEVGTLWMLRPWLYAEKLLPLFPTYTTSSRLAARFRSIYPNIVALEEIAVGKGIEIREPFQGAEIGAFAVCAPTVNRYIQLLQDSDKTPESLSEKNTNDSALSRLLQVTKVFMQSLWGQENFSTESTSAENEMSVVQYAEICNRRILLTGDTGLNGLNESADFVESLGVKLPGLHVFDVPHHGSRRNVSSETLDRWLGPKLSRGRTTDTSAVISASLDDDDHPRKVVVRACIHRGAKVVTTENLGICSNHNSPSRSGWSAAPIAPYPEDQEE